MLSKTSTHVINALIQLARLGPEECEGVKSIAVKIKAPANYLGKLLQSLAYRKIVISQKGLGGGFRLGKRADRITLYEVVEPIENVTMWQECALGLKKCSDETPCTVHTRWKVVRETYYEFLRSTTIGDLTG